MLNVIIVRKRRWLKWEPQSDTWIALASIFCMTALYYLNTKFGYDQPFVFFFGFVFLGHVLLNTVIPAYVVLKVRGEGLAGLGITRNWLITSIAVSALLGALMYPALKVSLNGFDGEVMPNIAYNAIALWEPLFVFGWLQLRFERAFGILAGILMAGVGFATYHIGSYPADGLIVLLLSGGVYAAIFAVVRNLFILIPITWSVASTMGTIEGGFSFDWVTVGIYFCILILQIFILAFFARAKE